MFSPNSVSLRPVSLVKHVLMSSGHRPRKVLSGLYQGMVLNLDLQHETQFYLGLYERETFSAIRRSAAYCEWMVDVGAASGDLAIFFSRQYTCGIVHAFEPRIESLDLFRSNLILNGLSDDPRVVIHEGFVGTANDPRYTRLDNLDLDLGKAGFLKIDVEGHEVDVLNSANQLLTAGRVDVLVEVHSQQLETECIARLRDLGYIVRIIKNAWWRLIIPEVRPVSHNRWLWAIRPR